MYQKGATFQGLILFELQGLKEIVPLKSQGQLFDQRMYMHLYMFIHPSAHLFHSSKDKITVACKWWLFRDNYFLFAFTFSSLFASARLLAEQRWSSRNYTQKDLAFWIFFFLCRKWTKIIHLLYFTTFLFLPQ